MPIGLVFRYFCQAIIVSCVLGCFFSKAIAGVVEFGEACCSNLLFQDVDNALAGKCYRLEPEKEGVWGPWVLYK